MPEPRFRVCVFCGSRPGAKPEYLEAARHLGRTIAELGGALVYGGASVGLMGAVATAALEAGAEVRGVLPEGLVSREIALPQITELRIVKSLHERKALMAAWSTGFLALPGGFGTLDEFCEIMTWRQLGLHPHPAGLLNIAGYFDGFIQFLEHSAAQGFIPADHLAQMHRGPDARTLLLEMFPQARGFARAPPQPV